MKKAKKVSISSQIITMIKFAVGIFCELLDKRAGMKYN
jgi:hypothetical protein